MSESSTYPLRLPRSVKEAAEKMAREEGISMNQFVATAVAEKHQGGWWALGLKGVVHMRVLVQVGQPGRC